MELFFYILWIDVYLYVQYVCHDVMAKASLILRLLIKLMFLRWMKRQSDPLGFNCDVLLMLLLGVYLLLKINQCYHGNEVESCKMYSSFFYF